jgi:NitT/TauT family transport system ATP-binding protein
MIDVEGVYPNARRPQDLGQARLTFSNACVQYGSLEVLRGVDLTVRDREIVTIIGPSGCGKTTLLRSAAGLVKLSQGAVQIDGESVDRPLPGVTMVFQQFALFPWKTLRGNIAYGLRLHHLPRAEIERRVEDAIRMVGLSGFERSYPHQLSGGMQQRAGLARALVMEPRLLLMDEPFSAVDAQTREQLQFELLRIWDARPTAMLFVTHAIEEAVLMGDTVVVLAGRPAHVHEAFSIDLPRPRDRAITVSEAFVRARNSVWRALVQGSGGSA